MPAIELETIISAPIAVCFDLSRSIDLHSISTAGTNEKAIAGRTSGLIELNEFVTWQATHFFITQKLTSKITALEYPLHFRDEQVKGAFKSIVHDHYFSTTGEAVKMIDVFRFESPAGVIGKIFNRLVLTSYLRRFLKERNKVIKDYAENGKWREVIK